MAVLGPHVFDGVPLRRAAADAGVALRTAERWLAAYRAGGLEARPPRSDLGSRRRMPPELVGLVEGLALRRPPPKAAQVHREVARVATERGWPVPSYVVVRRIIAGLDRGLVSLAHRGVAGYRDDFELVLRRESVRPNDLWQADHTELDIMVLDESDQPVRPWLTVVLDDRSRAVAGFTVFLGDPTAAQTALALRQAIWRKSDLGWPMCGLPAALYCDHGADFTSEHIGQVCAETKIQLIHSTAGIPRGRGKIERFFGTVTTKLLPTLPGHIPPGNYGRPISIPQLTLSQLDAAIADWIVNSYHHRVHPETRETPLRRWLADGWLPRMPESLDELNLLAADRGHPPQGAPGRHPRSRPALPGPDADRVRRRRSDRPLRPARPGRDLGVSPQPVPVPGRVPGPRRSEHRPEGPAGRPQPTPPRTAP